ncbi:protein-methionine-sulfoxide reductase catalytic subunit MsrP [Halioxenophilus sp. WMMB6]|uniref:protein-methionine-sulfoxide reductase catalytic subunit MsrP n=1 Tax=Halioxenophilus sp. WMMB6 TaxID=3073815 RepID=UPI00295EAA57|nr:protein-methionine-sulfoxide reductase catalytic subunit MsrP [Halioxenophilus sp. WMMB6]
MLIRSKQAGELTEAQVTDESVYRNRRQLLKQMGFVGLGGLLANPSQAGVWSWLGDDKPEASLPERAALSYQPASPISDPLTSESKVLSYNNFYEFGLDKADPQQNARNFRADPWRLQLSGLVEKPIELGFEDLFNFPLEERIYRLRCVEAWSMVIPWVGFPLSALLAKAGINSSAKYVAFETLYDPKQMPGQSSRMFGGGIRYPYVEGLRLDEAMHPLTILAVGVYGKALPPQNGAPIRLVVPWKYGFKSIKSIVGIRLQSSQPETTWNRAAADEYGFYANVNPQVDHPRWSQAQERRITKGGLGSDSRIATQLFNGYGAEVAGLYSGMDLRRYF